MKLQHLIIIASLFTSLGVMAQTTSITEASAPAPSSPQTRPVHKMHDRMMKRHAWHLESLKTNLKLMPDQESQWTDFAASMRPQHPEALHMAMADMEKLTTPERIDRINALKAQRDVEIKKRHDATQSFYATLSEEQKRTFDQKTAKFMHRRVEAQHGSAS